MSLQKPPPAPARSTHRPRRPRPPRKPAGTVRQAHRTRDAAAVDGAVQAAAKAIEGQAAALGLSPAQVEAITALTRDVVRRGRVGGWSRSSRRRSSTRGSSASPRTADRDIPAPAPPRPPDSLPRPHGLSFRILAPSSGAARGSTSRPTRPTTTFGRVRITSRRPRRPPRVIPRVDAPRDGRSTTDSRVLGDAIAVRPGVRARVQRVARVVGSERGPRSSPGHVEGAAGAVPRSPRRCAGRPRGGVSILDALARLPRPGASRTARWKPPSVLLGARGPDGGAPRAALRNSASAPSRARSPRPSAPAPTASPPSAPSNRRHVAARRHRPLTATATWGCPATSPSGHFAASGPPRSAPDLFGARDALRTRGWRSFVPSRDRRVILPWAVHARSPRARRRRRARGR